MSKTRVRATLLGLLFLIVLLAGCLFAYHLAKDDIGREPVETVVKEVDLYRNQGLEPGVELDRTPDLIEEDRVVFQDRVLKRSSWTEQGLAESVEVLQAFLTRARAERGDMLQTYCMTVPLRIAFEGSFSDEPQYLELVEKERVKLAELEDRLLADLRTYAEPVPLMDLLGEHESEYLFYRTDSSWTARGAYYGAQAFLEAAGLETFPIEQFWETLEGSFAGELQPATYATDWRYVYLYRNYNPFVTLVDDADEPAKQEPMISQVRGGTGAFIGGGFAYCQLDGLAENGRRLMIVGDKDMTVLAPWMVTEFERIVCVDPQYIEYDELDFWGLLREEKSTDLLLVLEDSLIDSTYFVTPIRLMIERGLESADTQ